MFEQIFIKNFQPHRDLTIDLDERITTIVGPSDVGKSAVIRALRWVCLNVPVSSLIREGAKKAVVQVSVDGQITTRSRGSENAYALNGNEFKAFRTSVPDPISDHLNLEPINFQGQHDSVYWFSESSGEVSRQLNSMVNLGIIDETLSYVAREVNKSKIVVQVSEEKLAEAVKEKKASSWAVECDEDFTEVECEEKKVQEYEEDAKRLRTMIRESVEAERRADEDGQASLDSHGLLNNARAVGKATKSRKALEVLLEEIGEWQGQLLAEIPDMAPITAFKSHLEELGITKASLEKVLYTASKELLELNASRLRVKAVEEELREKTDNQCPLCGSQMDEG